MGNCTKLPPCGLLQHFSFMSGNVGSTWWQNDGFYAAVRIEALFLLVGCLGKNTTWPLHGPRHSVHLHARPALSARTITQRPARPAKISSTPFAANYFPDIVAPSDHLFGVFCPSERFCFVANEAGLCHNTAPKQRPRRKVLYSLLQNDISATGLNFTSGHQ